jgi:hypothetical protein
VKFEEIRDNLVSDPEMRDRLQVFGVEGGAIDRCIWAAFKHACKFISFPGDVLVE